MCINNLPLGHKIVSKKGGSGCEYSGSQEGLKGLRWTEKIDWELHYVVRYVMLKCFGPLDNHMDPWGQI